MQNSRARTLFRYALPAILTNTCIFLFTIVDGIFVGQGVGPDALGAVNIAMPYVMIASALNMLTSLGGVTVVAIRLGRGDTEGANQAFMHSLTACFFIAILQTILGVGFTTPLARMLGADDIYLPMVKDYLLWWSWFSIPCALSLNLQFFCRNDGSPELIGIATVTSTIVNIFLDWLFVFPMQLGLMGAALATGISQTVSWLIILSHFIRKKGDLRIRRFKPDGKLYSKVLFRGLPGMIAQFATPISTLCMNHVLMSSLGQVGVNAYSIISYIGSLTLSVLAGASEGLQPLFGQCYGAKQEQDMKYYFRAGILISVIGSALIITLVLLFSKSICTLFGADEAALTFTQRYLPQYAWGFIVSGINIMISAYFYSTKRSNQAIVMNILRSIVVNTLVTLGLPALFGTSIIWYTFGIYEMIIAVISVSMYKNTERKGIVYR